MGMMLNERTSISDEYRKCYPKEKMNIKRIRLVESTYRQTVLLRKTKGDTYLPPKEFSKPEYFFERWGATAINDYQHLLAFLKSPQELGGIYVRRHYPPYNQNRHQTMRNTSIANNIYEFGNSYVGMGFVDLFQIAWGQYKDGFGDKVLTFHGYDAIRVTTLKSKIIYGIMKYYTEEEISTVSLLQIWFSSCWDSQTTKAFDLVMQDALSSPHKYQLDTEDQLILTKWQKETISKRKAEIEFSKGLRNCNFDDVYRMKNGQDRVKFCRYLFTGAIFVDEKEIVCGNKTMFADVCGTTKIEGELFFKAIDLTATGFQKDRHANLLYDTIVGVTRKTVQGFRSFVKMGQIVCHLHTKFIETEDMEFAATIKGLNPYSIDWSNLPDYFEKNSFIRFARACSVDDTVHTMHFLNWPHYVFGAVHIDWVNCQDRCQLIYRGYKKCLMKKYQVMQQIYQDKKSMLSFFEAVPYINPLNEINMFLALNFRRKFEDFFLSDENGKLLPRFENNLTDSIMSSFFDQSFTMIRSAFTFTEDLKLASEISS